MKTSTSSSSWDWIIDIYIKSGDFGQHPKITAFFNGIFTFCIVPVSNSIYPKYLKYRYTPDTARLTSINGKQILK
jgi:hypothetical protein